MLVQLLQGDREAMRALMRLDIQSWERVWLRWVLGRNQSARQQSDRRQQALADGLAGELDALRARHAQRRTTLATDQRSFHGNERHLQLLQQSLGIPDGARHGTRGAERGRSRPNLQGPISHV
jgi:hypothetical protein